ncbi:Ubiquinone biosynthesis O-methyltransferase, mitochondrial [Lachnellula hyalina]|uniref:Ubiquinone biosynthesis O-methyltransferase, mitochondrial n=1 Tax=Lachnellula hyalina TaxID=1316788 RepID=A0A8H8R0S4_9HELO|nr:Ubiquinone biosynthesis O-methyltransferase, mitochondrial [Lachnellula hyalina]TVY24799.1 Ubiquinone biosynthesis O-methyltransferase, mitochondrial [Lachnellula hyalina]
MAMAMATPLRPTSLRNLHLLLRTAPRFVHNQFGSHNTSTNSSSVNPTEVSHFNALASTWWDPHGSSRLLHLMNPLRHDFIHRCHGMQPVPPPSANLRYLDIGCGGGIFAESAARLTGTGLVTAIDPSPEVLGVAQAHARRDPGLSGKLSYLNTSIEGLAKPGSVEEQYDVLSLFEVIEHITHPAEFLDACQEYVKPGGWIVMSTIARTWTSWFTTKLVAEDLVGIVPRGTHDWGKYINEEELRGYFLEKRGWNSPMVMGVVYVPGLGWKEVSGSEKVGNYFFGIRKDENGEFEIGAKSVVWGH